MVENPDPVLGLFNLCSSMKWAHLPMAGGLYDQDPELLRRFEIIFGAVARHEKAEAERRDNEAKDTLGKQSRGGPPIRGGRMRR